MSAIDSPNNAISREPNKRKIVFAAVVLHYLSSELTRQCVSSLQDLKAEGAVLKVVIVDNGSPNGSGEKLREIYAESEDVHVLVNSKNEGFSVANNKGFEYAVKTWNPKAILVLNNDIQIVQEDFFELFQDIMRQSDAYVISPDVYVPRTNAHQSPLKERPWSPEEIERALAYYRSVLDGTEEKTLKHKLKKTPPARVFLRARARWRKYKKQRNYRLWRANVVPSGAALIFTRRFIETGELPFVPETFLYYEEDILALRCERNGWDILYCPELQVLHLHEGVTKEMASTKREKELFIAKHYYDSLCTLLEYRERIASARAAELAGEVFE